MTLHRPRVMASDRRLADVARPAGGRAPMRQVMVAAVGCDLAEQVKVGISTALAAEVGPARRGAVTVEICWSLGEAALVLARPDFAHLPEERMTIAMAGYGAALATLGHAALIVAHCLVLWPQVESSLRWNLS